MEFRTVVDIPKPSFLIEPLERMLFVGSCFADGIGQKFVEERFRATVNPYGTMYNPASILHTVERFCEESVDGEFPRVAFFTLGTNHVYRLNATGEIVDNCQKRPQRLFTEEALTVDEIVGFLQKAIEKLRFCRADVHVVLTVSPIRYAKYGYHESQLSKATLLLAVGRKKGVQSDYNLAAHFRWVMQEKVNVNWMSEMEKFIATVNQGYQDEGRRNSYMKIDPGQGLFIIHKEKHGTVESWEEAFEELSGIIGSVSVFKQCAEAGYTFLFEAVDEDDNITYSYKFTPEDYNK